MGHAIGKDVYRKLGKKIDGLTMRAPWNERLHTVLKELYTAEEAELIASMPYSPVDEDGIVQTVGWDRARIEKVLESLCFKGLMLDVWTGEKYLYIISPLVIGIFEFTMMRTEGKLNTKEWARLFRAYMEDDHEFLAANFGKDKKVSPLRTLPHEGAIDESEFVEVLDYEKATAIVEKAGTCAIGLCSCRHERFHLDEKACEVPLEACSSFGTAADIMIQHGFAKKVSETEMLENLARSKEMGLVFCADNVKNDVSFICHCCGCCCNVLRAVSRYGFPNMLVTSNFIARTNEETCSACGTCADQCPIDAITMNEEGGPQVDEGACLGCGVCALACPTESMRLTARPQRVFHPENTFERVILQCLERGTLQNQMFSDPGKLTHRFMRGVVGGFLRLPPVKQTIMSDTLRSRFLATIARRA